MYTATGGARYSGTVLSVITLDVAYHTLHGPKDWPSGTAVIEIPRVSHCSRYAFALLTRQSFATQVILPSLWLLCETHQPGIDCLLQGRRRYKGSNTHITFTHAWDHTMATAVGSEDVLAGIRCQHSHA